MRKLFNSTLVFLLVITLAGCCSICGKKAQEDAPKEAQEEPAE